jgi:hemoglobin
MTEKSLYERLGCYDGITEFVNNLLPRLQEDSQLRRFWDHRGTDRLEKEKQLLIDYLCTNAGGQLHYSGRDMKLSHKGMNISESDWQIFLQHAGTTMEALNVPQQEQTDVSEFVASLKNDIVEVD